MIQSELEHAQKAMQEQWYDLIVAEQQGSPLDVLERMYDMYILLADEYNRTYKTYQQEKQPTLRNSSIPKSTITRNLSSNEDQKNIKLAS